MQVLSTQYSCFKYTSKNINKDYCMASKIKHEIPTCTLQKYRKPFYIQYNKTKKKNNKTKKTMNTFLLKITKL